MRAKEEAGRFGQSKPFDGDARFTSAIRLMFRPFKALAKSRGGS
jgi:hypothetical protein